MDCENLSCTSCDLPKRSAAWQTLIERVRVSVRKLIFLAAIFVFAAQVSFAGSFPSSGPTTPGNEARLCRGLALAPANAPLSVKRAIWAANQLRTKPYRYGGGHRSFNDRGYDCSSTVSYALAGAGLVSAPLSSNDLRAYGSRGPGKWITVYVRSGHAFAVIAGLRLDTTSPHNPSRRWAPRWQSTPCMPFGFEARHPIGL
jgi:hypothetical protein